MNFAILPIKIGAGWAVSQGIAVGGTVVATVHSGLSPFAQALIIALVSSLIGAMGAIVAALIALAGYKRTEETALRTEKHVEDLKSKVGADRRADDMIGGTE